MKSCRVVNMGSTMYTYKLFKMHTAMRHHSSRGLASRGKRLTSCQ